MPEISASIFGTTRLDTLAGKVVTQKRAYLETYFVVDHMIGKLFFAQNIAVYDQSRILTMLIIETYLYETYKKQQKR